MFLSARIRSAPPSAAAAASIASVRGRARHPGNSAILWLLRKGRDTADRQQGDRYPRQCAACQSPLLPPHQRADPPAGCSGGAVGGAVWHGEGFHFELSGSRLNDELVMNGCVRYFGSSTTVVTVNHCEIAGPEWRL